MSRTNYFLFFIAVFLVACSQRVAPFGSGTSPSVTISSSSEMISSISSTTAIQKSIPVVSKTGSSPSVDELESIDANWNLYVNHSLGFSMKVPKLVKWAYGGSKEHPPRFDVPVVISSNSVKKVVEIKPADSYGWIIEKVAFQRLNYLPRFIKDNLGKDCEVDISKLSGGDSLIPFRVTFKDGALDQVDCKPRGTAWAFYWSPNENALFYWNVGQESIFSIKDESTIFGHDVTGEMLSSFQLN